MQRYLLFQLRGTIIKPFGETALQVFARISALRDSLDGPQVGPGPVQEGCQKDVQEKILAQEPGLCNTVVCDAALCACS